MQKWKIFASRATTRSFKLHFMVCDLKGLPQDGILNQPNNYLIVQLEWRGARSQTRYLPQEGTERNCTSKQCIRSDGVVNWNEGFDHDCNLKLKDSQHFKSWVVNLEIHRLHQESNSEASTLAKVKVDIAEFASLAKSSKKTISIPVKYVLEGSTADAMLVVQLAFYEVQTKSNSTVHPLSQTHRLPSLSSCIRLPQQSHSTRSQNPKVVRKKNDIAGRRTSLKQEIDSSASDSESGEEPEFSYRSLSAKNLQQVDLTCSKIESSKKNENQDELRSENHLPKQQPSLVRLLSWNKRKLSFRSLTHPRDIPLLNKDNCENGGDDIDNDRRYQFISPQPIQTQGEDYLQTSGFLSSDRFEVGAWEERKLVSRDGSLELETEIFLASIDQRSDKAAGGSACTVLVAVIADWLHQNPKDLPLRCQLDKLVREGSSEWRKLCENETLKERFSDQHFDLDTVLQAKVRPLSVISEQSYIGFFALENMSDQFEFLQGAMSFDSIWEKLQSNDAPSEEHIYIVSWNDHFFLLKVEVDAIYIIDTLGERLFEGCNKAYILKFNKDSRLHKVKPRPSSQKLKAENTGTGSASAEAETHEKNSREIVSEGKDSCKEFIKGFLAALPLRELQADIARGKMGEAPLHHRLQIEFHYTAPCMENSCSNMQTEEKMPSQVPNYYTNNIPDPKDISLLTYD